MITLDFKGPYHFDQIKADPNLVNNLENHGIYIWGFMYRKENNSLGDVIEFNKEDKKYDSNIMQFIPYYVGQGNGTSIFTRLNSHHKPRHGHSSKYIRLSMNYMKSFFTDYDFPIKYKRKPNKKQVLNMIKKNSNNIEFFNEEECLREIYSSSIIIKKSGKKNKDCKITEQYINGTLLDDTLEKLINTKNNFWFYYALKPESANITEMETFTFWSLKGITVSETQKFETVKLYDIKNRDNTIFKDTPSEIFNGY